MINEPIGTASNGEPVFLKDIWPSNEEIRSLIDAHVHSDMFRRRYADVYHGDERWRAIEVTGGDDLCMAGDVHLHPEPALFHRHDHDPDAAERHSRRSGAGGVRRFHHHRPHLAGRRDQARQPGRPISGRKRRAAAEFNSYGARRGNHEVMMRGTFANIRIRNRMLDGVEGGFTRYAPTGEADGRSTTRPCATRPTARRWSSSPARNMAPARSRDWAAKGTMLLGVRAVIAESFERIHRSNLVGMGVLPLQFQDGEGANGLGLDGSETFTITGIADIQPRQDVEVEVTEQGRQDAARFMTRCRIDTYNELEYFHAGRDPSLRAEAAGGLMADGVAITAACHCGRARITMPGTPEQVTQCNCSLCTKTGFRGVYFGSRRAGHRRRVRFLRSQRPQAAISRQPSLQDLRHPHPLDAAERSAARADGGQRAADRRRAGRPAGQAGRRQELGRMTMLELAIEIVGWAGAR